MWAVVIHFAGDSNVYRSWDYDGFCHLKSVSVLFVLTMMCSKYGLLKITLDKKIAAVIWILLRWQIMKNEFEKWTPVMESHIWVKTKHMEIRQDFGGFHLPQHSCLPSEKY